MDKKDSRKGAASSSDPRGSTADYEPISDYGAIGDCHGFALVSRNGSIDWCTIGRFDADPVFCRILDSAKGGYLAVSPVGSSFSRRAYLPCTNILRSEAETDEGTLAVTDFMVVGRKPEAGAYDYVSLRAPGVLIRRIECVTGKVSIDAFYRPSVDFARQPAELREEAGGYAADGGRIGASGLRHTSPSPALSGRNGVVSAAIAVFIAMPCSGGSRPVRVGNAAYEQRQLDVYGYVEDAALVYRELGGRLPDETMMMLAGFVDVLANKWKEPDFGIWELRSAPRQLVHSKLMCWIAVDRAIQIFGERPDWMSLRTAIADEILAKGRNSDGALQSAYDDVSGDAALLLLSNMAFPGPQGLMAETIRKVERELRHGDFVRRYLSEDGLEGREGYFLVCSFWLVDALLAAVREKEARGLYENLLNRSSDLGLFSEEIEEATGAFLGNFPQAYTHLGLVVSAINLELYEKYGVEVVQASYAARAKRAVTATFGWRGLLAAFLGTGRKPRLFSSKRSKLAESRR